MFHPLLFCICITKLAVSRGILAGSPVARLLPFLYPQASLRACEDSFSRRSFEQVVCPALDLAGFYRRSIVHNLGVTIYVSPCLVQLPGNSSPSTIAAPKNDLETENFGDLLPNHRLVAEKLVVPLSIFGGVLSEL